MIRIDIVSDAVCPWCFIGKRRLERALAAEVPDGIVVGWRPFQLNPDLPADGMDRKEYLRLKFGSESGGERYKHVIAAGLEEGIPFDFGAIKRTPNTIAAHRLIRRAEAEGTQDATVEALFQAYFTRGADIGDLDTLADIAASIGADRAAVRAYLESGEGDAEVRAEDQFARQVGIQGVPCFVVERKYAISGAQPPEAFAEVFARVRTERANA
ncbi:MAG: DsbA family oxidoreductase [Tagaea sp.]|nr:DsbA family oxidoreductase [Tagaea sp.]